jgi:hypothetical protein
MQMTQNGKMAEMRHVSVMRVFVAHCANSLQGDVGLFGLGYAVALPGLSQGCPREGHVMPPP